MPNPEYLLALEPGEPESEEEWYIPTIYDYLRRTTPELPHHLLSNHFVLPELTPLLREIAAYDHEVFVRSEEDREKMMVIKDPAPEGHTFWNIVDRNHAERQQRRAEKKAQGERFSVITYDLEKESFHLEEPVGGTYSEINISLDYYSRFRGAARLPILEVHTHPDNAIFSPMDYTNLITALRSGRRFYRGSIVICPDIQILALATSHTPILDVEEADAFIDELDNSVTVPTTPTMQKHVDEYKAIKEQVDAYSEALEEEFSPYLEALEAIQKENPVDDDTYLDTVKTTLLQVRPSFIDDLAQQEQTVRGIRRKVIDEVNQLLNSQQIGIARRLNLRLYSSHNMTDWTAFSA